jgi:hypothetical protein
MNQTETDCREIHDQCEHARAMWGLWRSRAQTSELTVAALTSRIQAMTADNTRLREALMKLPYHGALVKPSGPYVLLSDLQDAMVEAAQPLRKPRQTV